MLGGQRHVDAQQKAKQAKEQEEDLSTQEFATKILVCQRGLGFLANVPLHLQHVFKTRERNGEVLQRQLKGHAAKAAQAMLNAELLQEYRCVRVLA